MKTDKDDTVAQIITLPRRFHGLGNVSMVSLLEGTGYFGLHDQISEDDIRKALLRCPECIREWVQYPEDKRTSSGWYITENDEGCYEVGNVTEGGDVQHRLVYDNQIDACAAFVKREIENIIPASAPRPRAKADQD
ncbi:MAG: hypothetical protein IRY93_12725 [Chthoniobacterales bacterium]|nr:hypothetical protein [Chthoniobacterales bacterium]